MCLVRIRRVLIYVHVITTIEHEGMDSELLSRVFVL